MEDSRGLLQGTNPYIHQDKSSELQKPALMTAGNPAKVCVHPKECYPLILLPHSMKSLFSFKLKLNAHTGVLISP